MASRLRVVMFAFVGLLCGTFVGYMLGDPIPGAVFGLVIGVPLGVWWNTKRRRWVAVALLNLELIAAGLVGGLTAFLLALAATALTFYVSAGILRDFYGSGDWEALQHHLSLAIGLVNGFQIIDEGRTVLPPGKDSLMGPRLLIVRPNNAVVLENGSKQSDVRGPSIAPTQRFEYVKRVYDLRDKRKQSCLEQVLTQDVLPVTVDVSVTYHLAVGRDARLGQRQGPTAADRGLTQVEKDSIRNLYSWVQDWEQMTWAIVESVARQMIGQIELNDLLQPACQQTLQQTIQSRVHHRLSMHGIAVDSVHLVSVRPDASVVAAATAAWIETTKAEATRQALNIIADAYVTAHARGMTDDEVAREVLRRTLEELGRDPATKLVLTPEMKTLFGGNGNP